MDVDELSVERIIIALWCIVVLFTDAFDFGQFNVAAKFLAVFIMIFLPFIARVLHSNKPSGTTYKLTTRDYITLMESKGFHFTKEQKWEAEKEECQ